MNKEVGKELVEKMMHAVGHLKTGGRYSRKKPWRNHYAADECDIPGFELLRGMGLVVKVRTTPLWIEPYYAVTEAGIAFLRAVRKLKTQAGTR